MSTSAHTEPFVDEPIQPVPFSLKQDSSRAKLGRMLFNETRLSVDGSTSCASCHDLGHGGVDHRRHSLGVGRKSTGAHAPTVLNAALNFRQFWNGRAASLEEQVGMVVQSPTEMGPDWNRVVATLAAEPVYRKAFAASFPDGVTRANVEIAIATYERTLITPNSRFDRYLRGDMQALSAREKAGYANFKKFGCAACHQGVNVGGNMYQKLGVMGDYFRDRGHPIQADLGLYLVTGKEKDRHVFKVPGLRNVALTAPYFHDGYARTLEAAVDIMFRYQLGRVATADDQESIVAFLRTLTGELEPLR